MDKQEPSPSIKRKSPFKDKEELKKEILGFINFYKASIANQADRMSDFFEMSCFNYIVKYYNLCGYEVRVENLQKGQYRYKCSTMGIQSNFSFFSLKKTEKGVSYEFEIHHNLAIQSAHHSKIFTTPDITIIKANGIDLSKDHYETKIAFTFVKQQDLISFCEVKQFNPYPELLFNFIGVINELCPDIMSNTTTAHLPGHLAPTLMVSGIPNRHANDIKASLESRYRINIIYNLFYSGVALFSKSRFKELNQTGSVKIEAESNNERESKSWNEIVTEMTMDDDAAPF
jgi:hypothetical protein